MLNHIINFSIKNKFIVALFVVGLIVWGAIEVTRLPIDAVPDITDNQIQVITISPSLGAPDIERLITFPVEQSCNSIRGLKQIRSFSRFGLSLVTIVFDDGTDIYWARQQVSEQLQKIKQDLPSGIGSPEMAPVTTGLGEIYQYVVRPEKGYEQIYDATALRTIQDWTVRRQLIGTPGVAEVSSFGGKLKQYEVAVDQNQLKAHNLTISDLYNALENNNQNTGGAYIERGPSVLYIRSEGLTASIEDIRKIVVKVLQDGTPLLVRDVATVQYGSAIRYGAMTYNDKGEVAGAVVMMLKGENSSAVIKRVKARIAEIQKTLPKGVVIDAFLDRSKMVNNAISTVETNLIEGALIVIFVLVFFLGNLRAGLIVSSVIPLSMLFAIILMNMFGIGGNLMSLGAIDFGLIVDGSVIVIEAILHRFAHSKHFRGLSSINQTEMDTEVGKSTGAMIKSAVFSQIIILIVYLPILSLQGIEGKMFKPMAYTIAFAILGAFILSVTYVPMMAALCLNKKLSHQQNMTDRFIIWLERKYNPLLAKVFTYPKSILAGTLAIFSVSIYLLLGFGGEFIPQLEEGDFAVETRLLAGSNLTNTIKYTQQASKILLERFPEVQKVVTKIGSAEVPTDPMPMEAGDMIVVLKDKKDWTSASSFAELSEKMSKQLEEVPGITVGFQFPVQMRFNELMTGARQDVVCKIFGEDLDSLAKYAHRLATLAQTIDGATNVYEEKVTGMPQVIIKYNRDAMAKFGLNISDINRVVNAGFAGQIAGQVYEGEKRFDMVVRLAGSARKNMADIGDLVIATPSGLQIPLKDVAAITEVEGVNQIQREQTRRRIIVGFNISGRDVQTIVNELQQKVKTSLQLPAEYRVTYGGTFENMAAAKERLAVVVPLALLLIFLLLYFAFSSVKQGLLIYSAIPLSATGGIFALWLRGMPFSISAGVGFIALFGVAVLNGILLVSEFNRLHKEGWKDPVRIALHATKSKLRAVLMTALVPSLGFIPMAISTGAGGEVQKPLATVVIGGLIISTLLSLFVLPLLYVLMEKYSIRKKQIIAATALLLIAGAAPVNGYGQQNIRLSAALDSAAHNNLSIRVADAETAYYQALKKSGTEIDRTMVTGEYGSYNSLAKDNRFAVSQTFQFPTVYNRKRDVNVANLQIAETALRLRQISVQTRLTLVFYNALVVHQKTLLLAGADSLFGQMLEKTKQRLAAGDADGTDLANRENQRLQIADQLQAAKTDYEILVGLLQVMMNTNSKFEPVADSITYPLKNKELAGGISPSPFIRQQELQMQLASAYRKLEQSKLLPTISAGYNNTSIIGWQRPAAGADVFFDQSKRFSSVNVSLGIPIFHAAQRAQISAYRRQQEQKKLELALAKQELEMNIENAARLYTQRKTAADNYASKLLPNTNTIIRNITAKLGLGEMSYLEWVVLINQAMQVRSDYYNIVAQMNEAAIEIDRLSTTN